MLPAVAVSLAGGPIPLVQPSTWMQHEITLLKATVESQASRIARRLCRRMESEVWPNRPVTISVGVAVVIVGLDSGTQLAEQADAALYHSKNNGRNRVTMAAGVPITL